MNKLLVYCCDVIRLLLKHCINYVSAPSSHKESTNSLISQQFSTSHAALNWDIFQFWPVGCILYTTVHK